MGTLFWFNLVWFGSLPTFATTDVPQQIKKCRKKRSFPFRSFRYVSIEIATTEIQPCNSSIGCIAIHMHAAAFLPPESNRIELNRPSSWEELTPL